MSHTIKKIKDDYIVYVAVFSVVCVFVLGIVMSIAEAQI